MRHNQQDADWQSEADACETLRRARMDMARQWRILDKEEERCKRYQLGLVILQHLMDKSFLRSPCDGWSSDEEDWDGQMEEDGEEKDKGDERRKREGQRRITSLNASSKDRMMTGRPIWTRHSLLLLAVIASRSDQVAFSGDR